jgi:hypothetical protein
MDLGFILILENYFRRATNSGYMPIYIYRKLCVQISFSVEHAHKAPLSHEDTCTCV